jgi:signal transduction histidine kinase
LTLAGVIFAAIAVAVTGYLVARATTADLVGDVEDLVEVQSVVLSELTSYAVFQGTWRGVDGLIDELASDLGVRIALTDFDGTILGDPDPDAARPSAAAAVIDPTNPLFQTDLVESQVDDYLLYLDLVAQCLDERGVPFTFDEDPSGLEAVIVDHQTEQDFTIEAECYEKANSTLESLEFVGLIAESVVEPAVLFLGTAPTPTVELGAILLAAGLVLAVLIVGVAVLSNRLARPLTELTAAATAVRAGDLSARVDTEDTTEIGPLATAFNDMADEQALALDVIPLVLDDIIDQVVEANRGRADSQSIGLASFGSAPEPVDLGPGRIRQAIDNLVSNAIRHTPEGGSITLSVSQSNVTTTVEVRDSGAGIPEDFLDELFERFARTDQSRHRGTGGAGLGLAVTRQLVRAHGGDVTAHNHPDGGTVFTVTLPGA